MGATRYSHSRFSADYDYTPGTFDPDPPNASIQDLDDKIILQKAGGNDEEDYNLPSSPPEPHNNHRIWFDRDGVDQWQAQNPLMIDGGTYNTNGIYRIVIRLHAINATRGTAYMTINGLDQGFETDNNWSTMELSPAGMTFTGNMSQMQIFYGLYGYGAMHSVSFENITVTQVDMVGPEIIDVFAFPEWPNCNYGTVENPIRVVAVIIDESGVYNAKIHWKFNGSEDYSKSYFMQPLGGYENNSWQTLLTIPPQYIADGVVVKYKIFAMDNLNNSAQMENYEPLFVYDCLPPETTKSYSEPNYVMNDTTYITPDTEISLVCSDNGSGCNATYYRIDGGGWKLYNGSFKLNLSDGVHTIEYYSVDNANNSEEIKAQNVTLVRPPSLEHTFGKGWVFFSIPLILFDENVASVFENCYNASELEGSVYKPVGEGNGSNYPAYEPYPNFTEIVFGKGYILYNNKSCTINVSGLKYDKEFVRLFENAGWYLIGVPFTWNISFDDIIVGNGSQNKSFVDAATSGWLQPILFSYEAGEGYISACPYINNGSCDYNVLEPWKAYWLLTLEDNITFFISWNPPLINTSSNSAPTVPLGGGGGGGGPVIYVEEENNGTTESVENKNAVTGGTGTEDINNTTKEEVTEELEGETAGILGAVIGNIKTNKRAYIIAVGFVLFIFVASLLLRRKLKEAG